MADLHVGGYDEGQYRARRVISPKVAMSHLTAGIYTVTLYRITQEALNNCLKHAHATQVIVELMCLEGQIQLQVIDNGRGYRRTEQRLSQYGMGFAGMRERLRPLGGHFLISEAPTGGMVLTVTVPQQEKCDDGRALGGAVENGHRG
jgi:signal transduction histidine kinase